MVSAGLERSAVLRGSEGFGNKHRLQSSSLLTLSEDLPMVTLGVGIRNQVERAAGEIRELAPEGLVTVEPVESPAPAGTATGIQVWLRRGQKLGSEPAHVGVVRLLARHGAAAAVCLLGVDGTTASRRERARFFSWNGSVPMVVRAAGAPDAQCRFAPIRSRDCCPGPGSI